MSDIKNTYEKFQLQRVLDDGTIEYEEVDLTLTFGKLNVLRSRNNELYTRYCKMLSGKSEDILDMVTLIYVAYWCAHLTLPKDKLYTEDEFIELVPFDMPEIKRVYNSLMQPKKK